MKILAANTILYCRHWLKSAYFYRDILKLDISFQKDNWFIEFKVNGAAHLSIADATRCTIAAGDGVGITLSFFVQDLQDLYSYLVEQQVTTTPIKAEGWRAPYFYAYDPEGTRIEFWTNKLASEN